MKKLICTENRRNVPTEIENVTKQLFNRIALLAISFGSLATIGSITRIFQFGLQIPIIIDAITYFLIILLFLMRRWLPTMVVAALFLILLSINACTTIFLTGFITASMTMLCSCCIVAGTIFGFRTGCIGLLACTSLLTAAAVLFTTGKLVNVYSMNDYLASPQAWLSMLSGFFVFSFISLIVVHFIHKTLKNSVTELKIRSEELCSSEKKYRLLAENMRDVLLQLDTMQTITYISPSVKAIFGFEPDEIIGSKINILSAPQKSTLLFSIFTDFIQHSEEQFINLQPFECELNKKNGAVFPAEFTPSLIRNSDGSFGGIQGIIRDISQQKHAEKEKVQLENQLHHSEKLEVIGQLAGGIAHDFNNQLAGILGFAELIKSDYPKESETYTSAQSIASIAKRSADLTSKLLAFARKGNYVSHVFDLHGIINEIIEILLRSIDRTIKISGHLEAERSLIKGDPGQIQNALLNIALNARDAMQNGGTLNFSTCLNTIDSKFQSPYQRHINPGQYIHIIISDTGTGISDETKQHLFEPFFTTKETGKGTGMGLAAVYGTIQAHEGILNVTSVVGKGTSFHIYLPVSNDSLENPEQENLQEIAKGTGNILVVEDELNVGKMMTMILKRLGYSFEICTNGIEAFELYKQRSAEFDAIILDLVLPGMSGTDLLRRMREINNNVRILICSGYSTENISANVCNDKKTIYIRKPFSMNELSRQIDLLLHYNARSSK
jgi:two-component system, cell cycle sensor histidine kinase and response regulator CckA